MEIEGLEEEGMERDALKESMFLTNPRLSRIFSSEAALGRGRGGFYLIISLKRQVRTAQGRAARPKPTSYIYFLQEDDPC